MFTTIRHARVREPHAARNQPPSQPHAAHLVRVEQRLTQLKHVAVISVRMGIILLGMLAFHWKTLMPVSISIIALSATVGCVIMILDYAQRLAGWQALVLDSLAITFLLYGTGGSSSPLLALTILPMLLGGLTCNSNGVLAGSGLGVAILLIVMTQRHPMNTVIAELALLQIICGLVISMFWRQAEALLACLCEILDRGLAERDGSAQPASRGQDFYRQVAECTTIEQLARLTARHAMMIVGSDVQVDIGGDRSTHDPSADQPGMTYIPIPAEDRAGSIIVHTAPGDLSPAQRNELEQIASTVAFRSAALGYAAYLKRQQAAITALWEITGLLRATYAGHEHVRDSLARLSIALDLNWLALLAPNEYQALAPIMSVRGRPGRGAPAISGAQLRVATEALRGERPLVRAEGSDSLVCLPVCLSGHAPLVLAACGQASDAATQALLMLFGGLVAERLAANNATPETEALRWRAVAT